MTKDILEVVVFISAWLILNKWVFPKLGIRT